MSYFITGTDTGVGKTLISCALLHAFAAKGLRAAGFKPVAAGGSLRSSGVPTGAPLAGAADYMDFDHNDDALALRAASSMQLTYGQVNPYCFAQAVAPHIASQNTGVRIEMARILVSYRELAGQADEVIVEGAGGFMVPLNARQTFADLAKELGLPVILVVGMRLGCLNHALLTARAIADYGLEYAGWVANVLDGDMPMLQQNIASLRERLPAPLLGVVPQMQVADARQVAGMLDIDVLMKGDGHDQTD